MKKLIACLFGLLFSIPASATLPSGYTEVEYVNMPAGSYLLTDVVPTYDGRIEMDFQTTTLSSGSVYLLGGRTQTYGGLFFVKTSAGVFMVDAFGNTSTDRYTSSVTAQNNTRYKFTFNNKVATLESGGTTLFTNTSTGTLANGAALVINGLNSDGTISGGQAGIYLYSLKVWNAQGELVAGYVPAKNSSGVIGMYDLVNPNPATAFYTNAGTGEFTGGEYPSTCNANTTNLANMSASNVVIGQYIASNGVVGESSANFYNQEFILVQPNKTYTLGFDTELYFVSISEYDENQTFIKRNVGTTGNNTSLTITTGATTKYIRFGSNMYGNENTLTRAQVNAVNWMLTEGSTEQTYVPYAICGGNCNLFDKNGSYLNAFVNADTGVLTQGTVQYSYVIPVLPNTQYTLSGMVGGTSTWGSFTDSTIGTTATNKLAGNGTITTGPNDRYLIGMAYATGTQYDYRDGMKIERGGSATAYRAYSATCLDAGCTTYTTATGTVSQSSTPTPTNPITPTFYTRGNMVLRKVGDYADSYDASTGKITRRVGVKEFNESDTYSLSEPNANGIINIGADIVGKLSGNTNTLVSTYFAPQTTALSGTSTEGILNGNSGTQVFFRVKSSDFATVDAWKTWLSSHPVTVYYPLAEPVEETVEPTYYCEANSPIKIATTKYNNAAFSGVVTALSNAVDTIKTVVANTINQATAVANLHSGKQTKPTDTCPAGKTCLLVEDMNGDPHWYEIVESYYNPTLPAGYTELAYIESTGTQWIDTGVYGNLNTKLELVYQYRALNLAVPAGRLFGYRTGQNNNAFVIGASDGSTNPSATVYAQFDSVAPTVIEQVYVDADKHTIVLSKDGFYFDGSLHRSYSNPEAFETTATLPLFNTTNDISTGAGQAKVYSVKLWNGNTLVRDFVPARRESDGVLGMYDLANNQFYTNAGTGEFTAGPVVLPDGFTTLEYIQSTGTQYIDTGIIPDYTQYSYSWQFKMNNSEPAMFMGANGNMLIRYENGRYSMAGGQVSVPYTLNTDLIAELNVAVGGARSGTVNGTSLTGSNASQQNNIYIFNLGNQTGYATAGKIYYSKIYRNGSVIQDLVPAKRNSDNELGMYDTVNGQFYTNAGTGAFTAGPVAQ